MMSSSIELINPKAESVRRSAALQVYIFWFQSPILFIYQYIRIMIGEHQWCYGVGERRQDEPRYVYPL